MTEPVERSREPTGWGCLPGADPFASLERRSPTRVSVCPGRVAPPHYGCSCGSCKVGLGFAITITQIHFFFLNERFFKIYSALQFSSVTYMISYNPIINFF